MARLREMGLYDRAAIVVTADHGVSFTPGQGRRVLSEENAGEIEPGPLFLRLPGQKAPKIVDGDIQTIDILPTLADAVHARVRWKLDGHSALDGSFTRARIEVQRDEGDPLTFDPATLARQRAEVLRWKRATFGVGGDSLYVAGPHRELLGQRPAEVGLGPAPKVSASIDQETLLGNVDPTSGFLPAFITGTLEGTLPAGADLAVAVNGRIAATGRPFDLAGEHKYAALVPEDSLRRGRLRVQVLAITTIGGRTRLAALNRVQGENVTYSLDGDQIESSNGDRIRMSPTSCAGTSIDPRSWATRRASSAGPPAWRRASRPMASWYSPTGASSPWRSAHDRAARRGGRLLDPGDRARRVQRAGAGGPGARP